MNAHNNSQSNTGRPHLGLLYVQGLAVYLWYRLTGLIETVFLWLTAPLRWTWRALDAAWFRLKPWLARHKRRLLWSLLALLALSVLAGGVVAVYLWRGEMLALVLRLKNLVSRMTRRATPIIIATAPVTAQEVVMATRPGADGVGR